MTHLEKPDGDPDSRLTEQLPDVVIEFGDAEYRVWVNDAIAEAQAEGREICLEEAMEIGRQAYLDAPIAAREAWRAESMFARHPGPHHEPVVYYMRMSDLVKIGTTRNIRGRVEAIGPQGVLAVEIGAYDLERRRHRQFAEHHSHGEWFHLVADLWTRIAQIRTEFEAVMGQPVDNWLEERLGRSRRVPDSSSGP